MISLTKLQEDLSDVKGDLHEVHEQQVERRTKEQENTVTAEDYELVFNLRRCDFDLERSRRKLLVDWSMSAFDSICSDILLSYRDELGEMYAS